MSTHRRILCGLMAVVLAACGPATTPVGTRNTTDTGWIADTSFEVGADIVGELTHEASGSYAGLADDRALQEQLVDDHIKFAKPTLHHEGGYHLTQMAESVEILGVLEDGAGNVTIQYSARIDVVHSKSRSAPVPELGELDPLQFEVPLPVDPIGLYRRNRRDCAAGYGTHSVSEYNYYYYFAPDEEACTEPTNTAVVTLREVYPVTTVYPEYDRLLQPLDEAGETLGFRAALLPNRGDGDSLGRFNAHREMLEDDMELEGTEQDGGRYVRYQLEDGPVTMVVDLYNPTKGSFTSTFRQALGEYTLVWYNGHSAYGTQPFLTDADAFSDGYQIIGMHACRSYPYYVRMTLEAKATEEDPTGFANTDMVATGLSSYPSGSPPTLQVLLESLWAGITAVQQGRDDEAPSWQQIVAGMNRVEWGILYGVSGVRTNSWHPAE